MQFSRVLPLSSHSSLLLSPTPVLLPYLLTLPWRQSTQSGMSEDIEEDLVVSDGSSSDGF